MSGHERKADRLLVISPIIDARAQEVAGRLGIDTSGDITEVAPPDPPESP